MATRRGVSTNVGDRRNRPLLRFDVRDKTVASQNRRFGDRVSASINAANSELTAEGLSFSVANLLSARELAAIQSVPSLVRDVNRIVKNLGARTLERIRDAADPTYDTGAFKSAFRIKTDVDGKLKIRFEVSNPVKYALYVHRSGTPRSHTVVNKYIVPIMQRAMQELIEDLSGDSGVLSQALEGIILRPLTRGA